MCLSRFLILGAPGSGKGTIAKFLAKDFGFTHISTGDILRERNARGLLENGQLKEEMDKGRLIHDKTITDIVFSELTKAEGANQSWILDGFPRNLRQIYSLLDFTKIDLALNIEVPFQTIIDRTGNRFVHEPSGRVYNLSWNPPKIEGRDDITGELLTKRPDDEEEVVHKRLKYYETNIIPIMDILNLQKKCKTFKGTSSKSIYRDVYPFMEQFLQNKDSQSSMATASP